MRVLQLHIHCKAGAFESLRVFCILYPYIFYRSSTYICDIYNQSSPRTGYSMHSQVERFIWLMTCILQRITLQLCM